MSGIYKCERKIKCLDEEMMISNISPWLVALKTMCVFLTLSLCFFVLHHSSPIPLLLPDQLLVYPLSSPLECRLEDNSSASCSDSPLQMT